MNFQERFAQTDSLASVLKTAYIVSLLILVFAIFSDILQINLIQNVINGLEITELEANENDNRQMYVGIVQFLVTILLSLFS